MQFSLQRPRCSWIQLSGQWRRQKRRDQICCQKCSSKRCPICTKKRRHSLDQNDADHFPLLPGLFLTSDVGQCCRWRSPTAIFAHLGLCFGLGFGRHQSFHLCLQKSTVPTSLYQGDFFSLLIYFLMANWTCSKVRQQILCCGHEQNTNAPPRGGNMSKESRTSASKTFLTDMLHFSSATDKVYLFTCKIEKVGPAQKCCRSW